MNKIYIVYWSGTGNTEKMANFVAEGVKSKGKIAEVLDVNLLKPSDLKGENKFALGCPSMGAEQLEEGYMEPFVSELEAMVSGKQIGLFGSYGWGNCEWMRDWEERMQNAGATIIGGEGITAMEDPDGEAEANCIELGKMLAE
ncbi:MULTISPECIES: flavodoxin [unclassified Clostridioides]|uniref:flavodoxin n=1 Tax=unclassified Clostridioides TaxID=2635829 RepID=UPI001D11FE3E|nr:flavodoxin [Clostridioides sp. ES-S-0048-02]UDN56475.1 flavodoxin [Clostridioides sp. ES-S-0010-02]UDN60314.1 flavodoxin [Clostridioides sp. ES-W-0016-02]